jgi:tetratricopeptide (TPR) repeat protein
LAEALAHYSQALISESTLGGFDASLRHSRLAAEKDPSYLPLTLKVAAGYLARKENDRALMVLNRAKAYHPDSVEVCLLLGIVHQLNEKPDKAEAEFKDALQLAPDRSDVYVRLATLYAAESRLKKVLATVETGLSKCRDRAPLTEFCENIGRLYLQSGKPREALAFFECIRQPDHPAVKELTARSYASLGEYPKAVALFRELEHSQPENIRIVLFLGEIYEAQGDLARAEDYLSRGAQALPQDVLTWLQLANLQLRTSPARAMKTLRDAIVNNPDDLSIRAFLGFLYSRQKQFEAAILEFAAIEREAAKNPAVAKTLQPQFYYWYGSTCEQAGHMKEAERLLERCIALGPEFAQALNYLAYIWAEQGVNLDKAQDYAQRALEVEPGEGAFLDTLGWIHYRKGKFDEALKYLQKALADMPDDPVISGHVGDTWAALKTPRKARQFWLLSLKMNPENAAVRKKLIQAGADPATLPAPPSETK